METSKYIAEYKPEYRLQFEDPAPLATRCIFLTPYGSAVIGNWYSGCQFVAWSPLPKLTEQQHDKIKRYLDDPGAVRRTSVASTDTPSGVEICCRPDPIHDI